MLIPVEDNVEPYCRDLVYSSQTPTLDNTTIVTITVLVRLVNNAACVFVKTLSILHYFNPEKNVVLLPHRQSIRRPSFRFCQTCRLTNRIFPQRQHTRHSSAVDSSGRCVKIKIRPFSQL